MDKSSKPKCPLPSMSCSSKPIKTKEGPIELSYL